MDYLETHITDHCNLKCRGCSHFSCIAPPYYKPLDEFEEEISWLSTLTNQNLNIFRIMGGEPLLHPQWLDFYVIARHYFPKTSIVLVTNGILIKEMTSEQINTLNDNNIEVCISDYNLKLDTNLLKNFKKQYYHNKFNLYNISLDPAGYQNYETSFYHCDIVNGRWHYLKGRRIFECCIMANIDIFNKHFNQNIEVDLDDISIDYFIHTIEDVEKFLRRPHKMCRYCNTRLRTNTYAPFTTTKGDIKEWTL